MQRIAFRRVNKAFTANKRLPSSFSSTRSVFTGSSKSDVSMISGSRQNTSILRRDIQSKVRRSQQASRIRQNAASFLVLLDGSDLMCSGVLDDDGT